VHDKTFIDAEMDACARAQTARGSRLARSAATVSRVANGLEPGARFHGKCGARPSLRRIALLPAVRAFRGDEAMKIRMLLAALALSACASQAPAPAPAASAPPPPAVDDAPELLGGVAAEGVTVPPDAPPPPADPNSVVVPGAVERPVASPSGDPRSAEQRMRDIRAWDDCVLRAQAAGEADPTRPSLDQPEDVCRSRLGMASRNAVPRR
jgi:hypothetical protein